ncbi:MAG: hypothetical protein JSS02_12020 [Planctomycetes bacterium]|nr:hypothetical protein [Planctomycetota bacterium]
MATWSNSAQITATNGATAAVYNTGTNSGSITATDGLISLQYGWTNDGTISVGADGIGQFTSGTNKGSVTINGGDAYFAGTWTNNGDIAIGGGGHLDLFGTGTFSSPAGSNIALDGSGQPAFLNATNATLNLLGDVTITDIKVGFNSTTVNGPGKLIIATGTTLDLVNSTLEADVDNSGTIIAEGTVALNGAFANNSGALLELLGHNGGLGASALSTGHGFTNHGNINLTSDGNDTGASLTVLHNGTLVNATDGVILAGSPYSNTHWSLIAREIDNFGVIKVQQGKLSIQGSGSRSTLRNTGTITVDSSDTIVLTVSSFDNSHGHLKGNGTVSSLSIDGDGYLATNVDSITNLTGDLIGTTTNKNQFAPLGALHFSGTGNSGSPQLWEAMGQDLGNTSAGYSKNFAYGSVVVDPNTYVRLQDIADNFAGAGAEAVYVDQLVVAAGGTLDLNGLHLYARSMQNDGTVSGGTVSLVPDGGPLLFGVPAAGQISASAEVDDWTFAGLAGDSASIVLNPGNGTAPAPLGPQLGWSRVQIVDPLGQVVASADNASGSSGAQIAISGLTLGVTGTYHVLISTPPAQSSATGNYVLTASYSKLPPVITSLTPPAVVEGTSTGTIAVATFIPGNGSPDISIFTATIDWGDGTTTTATAGNGGIITADGGLTFTVQSSHIYTRPGSGLNFVVTVVDDTGVGQTVSAPIDVADAPLTDTTPVATYAVIAGKSTGDTILATFTDGNPWESGSDLFISVDWGGPLYGTATATLEFVSQTATTSIWQVVGHAAYNVPGTYTPVVTINDVGGEHLQSSRTQFTVTAIPVTILALTPPADAVEGLATAPATLAVFRVLNPAVQLSQLTAVIDWGDGDSTTVTADSGLQDNGDGTFIVVGSHTYADENIGLTFQVTVIDSFQEASDTSSALMNVADAPLTILSLTPPTNAVEGIFTGILQLATFSDANPHPDINDYTVIIDWGDGTTSTATAANGGITANPDGTFNVLGGHTFPEAAKGLTFGSLTPGGTPVQFDVADAPLTDTTPVNTVDATQGVASTDVVLATFTDGNPLATADDFSVSSIDWDGSLEGPAPHLIIVADPSFSGSGSGWKVIADSVLYVEAGVHTVSLTVSDEDGSQVSTSNTHISVVGAGLTDTTLSSTIEAFEGVAQNQVVLMSFTDVLASAQAADYSLTGPDWGGTRTSAQPSVSIVADPAYSGNGSGWLVVVDNLAYAEPGTYTVSLTVTDQAGRHASTSGTSFHVTDAPLTDTTTNTTISGTEGQTQTSVVLMTFQDGNPFGSASDFSVTALDWGGTLAGTAPNISIIADPSYSGLGSGWKVVADAVTYAEPGSYTVSLTVQDVDGAQVSSANTTFDIADGILTDTTPAQTLPGRAGVYTAALTLATFTDENPLAPASDFATSVNWGGAILGTPTVSVQLVSRSASISSWAVIGSVRYLAIGSYTVAVTVDDVDGASVSTSNSQINMTAGPLSDTSALKSYTGIEGNPTTSQILMTFTDTNPAAQVGDFQTPIVNWGGTVIGTPTVAVQFVSKTTTLSTWKVVGTATYAETGKYSVTTTVIDNQNAAVQSSKTTYTVADAPLTDVTVASTQAAVEGNSTGTLVLATFNDGNPFAPLSDFSVTVTWGGTLVGTPTAAVQLVSRSATISTWQVVGSATYASFGLFSPSVKITDVDGKTLTSAKTKINVADAPLTNVTLPSTLNAIEGNSTGVVTLATFTDANPVAPLTDFKAAVNWGGTVIGTPTVTISLVSRDTTSSTWQVTGKAVYAQPGTYTPVVSVSDKGGSACTANQTAFVVTDAPLTDTTPVKILTATEGKAFSNFVLATFTDANPSAAASDFTPNVTWNGDLFNTPVVSVVLVSRTTTGSNWKVVGSAGYFETGLYNVSVVVNDVDGGSVSTANTSINVVDAPLTDATVASTQAAVEGSSTGTLVLATFNDANPFAPLSDFSVTVTWGGTLVGTPTAAVELVSRSATSSTWQVVGSVTYASFGVFTPSIKIADVDGKTLTSAKTKINVADAPLTNITLPSTLNAIEGNSTGVVTLATFTDGNPVAPLTDFKAAVNWGGTVIGTPTVAVVLVSRDATSSTWQVTGKAVYAQPGTYTPVVSVSDKGGSACTANQTSFEVADAPLTDTTPVKVLAATEGKAFSSFVLATFTDANPSAAASDFTAQVTWNGPLAAAPTVAITLVSRTSTGSNWKVTGSGIYTAAGLYQIGVTVNDIDGSSVSTANTSLNVADAPLTDKTTAATVAATRNVGFTNVVLATFLDANPYAQASDFPNLSVDWGGPTAAAQFSLVLVSTSSAGSIWQVIGSATYLSAGTFSVTVTIPDVGGMTLISKKTKFSVTG